MDPIYTGEADSSLTGDDFNEEAWNQSMGCQCHLLSGEDLAPSARRPFGLAVWLSDFIGAHSLYVSKNYASSWEPVKNKSHVGSAFTEAMMWGKAIKQLHCE